MPIAVGQAACNYAGTKVGVRPNSDTRECPSILTLIMRKILFRLLLSISLFIPMVCLGGIHADQQLSTAIKQLNELKPDNIELTPISIEAEKIRIEGYATNTRSIPAYLHSIEDSKIGLVRVHKIVPTERNGRHVYRFVISIEPAKEPADSSNQALLPPIIERALMPQNPPTEPARKPADSSDQTSLPKSLEMFLKHNPSSHLLSLSDLADEEYVKSSFISHEPGAFQLADTNQDGKKDVAAVIVKDNKFSVVVLQASDDESLAKVFWLVRESTFPILGVFSKDGYVVPAFCVACEADSAYAWTGFEYGENVILKGGSVCLNKATVIRTSADEHSKMVYRTTKLENAQVIDIGLRKGEYFWHKVKLDRGQMGFVLNRTFNFEPGLCM